MSNILVIEPESMLRRVLHKALEGAGYSITESKTFVIPEKPYHVVIVDMDSLSSVNGTWQTQIGKLTEKETVILLTDSGSNTFTLDALDLGVFQCIQKPFVWDNFLKIVERAIKTNTGNQRVSVFGALIMPSALQTALDEAITSLWMAFQPIISASEKRVVGYEALMRSRSPILPHPGAILEAAERLNRLPDLGRHIRLLCAKEIAKISDENLLFFINLHPRDLLDDDLYQEDIPLAKFANRIIFEVTERTSLELISDMSERLCHLKRIGYRLAVDDLGAGYAGLCSIASLMPHVIKLDMSLVRNIDQSTIQQNIVRAVINLAASISVQIIAEGVETPAERQTLINQGCDLLQGYLLAKPGPPFPSVNWW